MPTLTGVALDRNLTTKKNRLCGAVFLLAQSVCGLLSPGNSLVRDMSPNLSFQCSRTQVFTSRTLNTSLAHPVYQWLPPVAIFRAFSYWTQEKS